MPTFPFKLTRRLIAKGLLMVPLLGCHSNGNPSPQSTAFVSPAQRGSNPQGVGAVRLDDEQKREIQFALGKTLEGRGELERAETVYRKIFDGQPDYVPALHRLAVVCDRQQQFSESETLFRQALKAAPDNSAICGDYGYSLYLQRRWSEAEDQLRTATALNPENRRAHTHLGLVFAETQRRKEALAEFALAGCTMAQAHGNLGLVAEMNGRLSESLAEYAAAAQADPENAAIPRRIERLKQKQSQIAATGKASVEIIPASHSPSIKQPNAGQQPR